MDVIEYVAAEKPLLTPDQSGVTMFVKQTLKTFADSPAPHCLLNTRKSIIYNKNPTTVKVLHRATAKALDVDMGGVIAQLALVHFDTDAFLCVLATGEVKYGRVSEMPDQSIVCSTDDVALPAMPEAIARVHVVQRSGSIHSTAEPTVGKQLVCFAQSGAVFVVSNLQDGLEAAVAKAADLESLPKVSAAGFQSGIVAHAGKHTEVVLRHADKFSGDVLNKTWSPHGDDATDSIHIFDRVHADGAISIATYSAACAELRLWSLAKGAIALQQTVTIAHATEEEPIARVVRLDADENTICLMDLASGSLVVAEVAETSAKVVRITEWETAAGAASFSPVYRKVSRNNVVRKEFTVIVRDQTKVSRFALDEGRLEGPANIGEKAEGGAKVEAKPAAESVNKWFGGAKPIQAAAPSTGTTSVTSSKTGQTTVTVDNKALHEEALKKQQHSFAHLLGQLDGSVMALERQANDNLSVLRGTAQSASAAGQDAAARNVGDVMAAVEYQNSTGSGDRAVNMLVLQSFTESMVTGAHSATQVALAHALKAHAGNAVDRAVAVTGLGQERDFVVPKATSLPSMQALGDVIEKAHAQQNDLFRRQKEQETIKLNAIVSRTAEKQKATCSAADKYLAALKAEVSGLAADVKQVSALSTSSAAAGAAAPQDEDTKYAAMMQCATTGQWGQAMLKATNAGSLPLLMRFLETAVVKENRSTIASSKVMTFPVFMALTQQLTVDLNESVGLIPQRIDWLNEIVVSFDAYLAAPSAVDKLAIQQAGADFSNVVDQLEAVDIKTAGIDRTTKRCLVLVKKALSAYAI